MGAELVVTAVLLMDYRGNDGWQPYDTLRHQTEYESLRDCEIAQEEMGDEIAAFMVRALRSSVLVDETPPFSERVRVTIDIVCQQRSS